MARFSGITVVSLDSDVTIPANHFDPELTYFADGTPLVMRAKGIEKNGVAVGMSTDSMPYQSQAVRWDEGGEDLVAPHVLHRAAETVS